MTPAAGRGGNPPSREHPISAGRRHPGGRLRTGQVTPPRADLAGSPPPAPAAGRRPQPRARPRGGTGGVAARPRGFSEAEPKNAERGGGRGQGGGEERYVLKAASNKEHQITITTELRIPLELQ